MSTIVVSDTHLGYQNSEHDVFERFLALLLERQQTEHDIEHLVILGDIIDMWRRDVSGIFLEFNSMFDKILQLQDKTDLICVAGNHDYHLLQLTNVSNFFKKNYHLDFIKDWPQNIDGVDYHFMHGYEFDDLQKEPLMELMCYTMSDKVGTFKSDFWDGFTSIGADFKFLETFFKLQKADTDSNMWDTLKLLSSPFQDMKKMMNSPSEREIGVPEIEKAALKHLQTKEKPGVRLIFGHTHVPFVDPGYVIANSGSWVNNETTYRTYLEIKKGEIHLMQVNAAENHDITGISDITETNHFKRHAGEQV